MNVKLFEIRDRATFIAVMAVRLASANNAEFFLLRRAGYGAFQLTPNAAEPYVILTKLDGVISHYDSYEWGRARTMGEAHRYIIGHWDALLSGDVIDVEYILGETKAPKVSERESIGE